MKVNKSSSGGTAKKVGTGAGTCGNVKSYMRGAKAYRR